MDLPSLDVLPPEVVCNIVSNVSDLNTINNFISSSKKYTDLIYDCVTTLTSKETVLPSLILKFKNLTSFEGYILINNEIDFYLIIQHCKLNKLTRANFIIAESYIYSRSYSASFYTYKFVETYLYNADFSIAQKLYNSRYVFIVNTLILENSIIFNPPIIRILYNEKNVQSMDNDTSFYDDINVNYNNLYKYLKNIGFLQEIQSINNSDHINYLIIDNIYNNPIPSLLIDDPIVYLPPYINSNIGILQVLTSFNLYLTHTDRGQLIDFRQELTRTQNYKNENMISCITYLPTVGLEFILNAFPNVEIVGITNGDKIEYTISSLETILNRIPHNIKVIYVYDGPAGYNNIVTIGNSKIRLISVQPDTQASLFGLV